GGSGPRSRSPPRERIAAGPPRRLGCSRRSSRAGSGGGSGSITSGSGSMGSGSDSGSDSGSISKRPSDSTAGRPGRLRPRFRLDSRGTEDSDGNSTSGEIADERERLDSSASNPGGGITGG